MPGLKKAEIDGRLEEAGIDMVYIVCVNDGAVMTAWKKEMGLAGSELIEFIADTDADLTEALGLVLTSVATGDSGFRSVGRRVGERRLGLARAGSGWL